MMRGEDVGTITKSSSRGVESTSTAGRLGSRRVGECTDILDRLDKTGLTVTLASLPESCRIMFARESAQHIALRRRNTIARDKDQTSRLKEHIEHHVMS